MHNKSSKRFAFAAKPAKQSQECGIYINKKKIIAENQELTYLPEEKKQLIQYTGVLAEQKFYCNIRQICFDCL